MKLGMEVGLGPGHIVLDGDPVPPPPKGGTEPPPTFRPCIVAKRLDGSSFLYLTSPLSSALDIRPKRPFGRSFVVVE